MAYTVTNFKTKKALKEAVTHWNQFQANKLDVPNSYPINPVKCFNPGLGPDLSNHTGKVCLEGPHYPKPHTWYAEAELVNGIVVKVK